MQGSPRPDIAESSKDDDCERELVSIVVQAPILDDSAIPPKFLAQGPSRDKKNDNIRRNFSPPTREYDQLQVDFGAPRRNLSVTQKFLR